MRLKNLLRNTGFSIFNFVLKLFLWDCSPNTFREISVRSDFTKIASLIWDSFRSQNNFFCNFDLIPVFVAIYFCNGHFILIWRYIWLIHSMHLNMIHIMEVWFTLSFATDSHTRFDKLRSQSLAAHFCRNCKAPNPPLGTAHRRWQVYSRRLVCLHFTKVLLKTRNKIHVT